MNVPAMNKPVQRLLTFARATPEQYAAVERLMERACAST